MAARYDASEIGGDLTAAQKTAARRVLDEIERILVQVPELGAPKGFEIERQFSGGTPMTLANGEPMPNSVVTYVYTLFFFAPTKKIAANGGCQCIQVWVNFQDVWRVFGRRRDPVSDEKGRSIYVEPLRGEAAPFTTQVYERLIPNEPSKVAAILTSGGEPYARPVTREQFYNAMLLNTEGKDGAALAKTRAGLETTPYQEWMKNTGQRKKEREDTLKGLAALQPPAEVAKMRKIMEDTERELTENLRKSDAETRQNNTEALAKIEAAGNPIRIELQSMTPAQRNLPALVDPSRIDGFHATGTTMADKDSPAIWRVLTPDYDFWRARKSPVEVRSIAVSIEAIGAGLVPAVNNALVQTYRKLDWAALNKLLDVPR